MIKFLFPDFIYYFSTLFAAFVCLTFFVSFSSITFRMFFKGAESVARGFLLIGIVYIFDALFLFKGSSFNQFLKLGGLFVILIGFILGFLKEEEKLFLRWSRLQYFIIPCVVLTIISEITSSQIELSSFLKLAGFIILFLWILFRGKPSIPYRIFIKLLGVFIFIIFVFVFSAQSFLSHKIQKKLSSPDFSSVRHLSDLLENREDEIVLSSAGLSENKDFQKSLDNNNLEEINRFIKEKNRYDFVLVVKEGVIIAQDFKNENKKENFEKLEKWPDFKNVIYLNPTGKGKLVGQEAPLYLFGFSSYQDKTRIVFGDDLQDNEIVDKSKNKFGVDCSILLDTLRVSTTLSDRKGERINNTFSPYSLIKEVMREDKEKFSSIDKDSYGQYILINVLPFYDFSGKKIGCLATGRTIEEISKISKIINSLAMGLFLSFFSIFSYLFFRRKI